MTSRRPTTPFWSLAAFSVPVIESAVRKTPKTRPLATTGSKPSERPTSARTAAT
jgi:hypothetical protein